MKAIILAAGTGSRMGKYTKFLPKGLLQLCGKSILEIQIDNFKKVGIEDISIVVGYRANDIHIEGVKYYKNDEFEETNMIVSFMKASQEFTDDIIVSYADVIYSGQWLEKLITNPSEVSVLVDANWKNYWKMRYESIYQDVESLIVDKDNNITEIGKPNVSSDRMIARYIGLIKFSVKSLERIIEITQHAAKQYADESWKLSGRPYKKAYMTDLLQAMIDDGIAINAEMVNNGWLEFDTEQDYEKALSWIESQDIDLLFKDFKACIGL